MKCLQPVRPWVIRLPPPLYLLGSHATFPSSSGKIGFFFGSIDLWSLLPLLSLGTCYSSFLEDVLPPLLLPLSTGRWTPLPQRGLMKPSRVAAPTVHSPRLAPVLPGTWPPVVSVTIAPPIKVPDGGNLMGFAITSWCPTHDSCSTCIWLID